MWFSRTGAQWTFFVHEHRKRRKSHQMTIRVKLSKGLSAFDLFSMDALTETLQRLAKTFVLDWFDRAADLLGSLGIDGGQRTPLCNWLSYGLLLYLDAPNGGESKKCIDAADDFARFVLNSHGRKSLAGDHQRCRLKRVILMRPAWPKELERTRKFSQSWPNDLFPGLNKFDGDPCPLAQHRIKNARRRIGEWPETLFAAVIAHWIVAPVPEERSAVIIAAKPLDEQRYTLFQGCSR